LDDELNRRIAEWQRRKTMFSLVMLDVDFFKKFNDKYGHLAGDAVLKGVARTLKDTMREMDFVARYGGEEFAAVLPVTNQREAIIAAERIRTAVEQAVFCHDGVELRVTCSVGVAQVLADNTAAEVVKRADAALYHSKSAGRNCVHYHSGDACRPASESLGQTTAPVPSESQASDTSGCVKPITNQADDCEHEEGFHADLRRRVAEARKFHVPLSLMMIEIDGFDELSDKYGMAISDLVYDTMGDFLRVVMQEMDVASRRGHGQFAIMMPGTDLESAIAVAERLRSAVEGHTLQVKGVQLRLTLSAGLSETAEHDDSSTLTKRAAAALFAARNGGRNCTYAHNGENCEAASSLLIFV
jgi:diguanylate cyclase (GGDEF)-like protein